MLREKVKYLHLPRLCSSDADLHKMLINEQQMKKVWLAQVKHARYALVHCRLILHAVGRAYLLPVACGCDGRSDGARSRSAAAQRLPRSLRGESCERQSSVRATEPEQQVALGATVTVLTATTGTRTIAYSNSS
jgi:hypothetical protein